jgi:hypothetical protein
MANRATLPMLDVEDNPLDRARRFQRALVHTCMSEEADPDVPAAWLTYRRMARTRFFETLEHAFERLVARLGVETFRGLESEFLAAQPPRKVVLRVVPSEFLLHLGKSVRVRAGDLPSWVQDLAAFEWAELDAAYAPNDLDAVAALTMDRPLAVASHVRYLKLSHATHLLTRDEPLAPIGTEAADVCIYREAESFEVRTLELSTSAAAILRQSLEGRLSLLECVRIACAETGETLDEAWLHSFSELIADFIRRGIVRGSR